MSDPKKLHDLSAIRREGSRAFDALDQAITETAGSGAWPQEVRTLYGFHPEGGPTVPDFPPIGFAGGGLVHTSGKMISDQRKLEWCHTEVRGDDGHIGFRLVVMLRPAIDGPPAALLTRYGGWLSPELPRFDVDPVVYELTLGDDGPVEAFNRPHLSRLVRGLDYTHTTALTTLGIRETRPYHLEERHAVIVARAMTVAFRDACRV